jgi:hypothetical protein
MPKGMFIIAKRLIYVNRFFKIGRRPRLEHTIHRPVNSGLQR